MIKIVFCLALEFVLFVQVNSKEVMRFPDLLEIFSKCSVTYYHVAINHSNLKEEHLQYESSSEHSEMFAKLRHKFESKVVLQFLIVTALSDATTESTVNVDGISAYKVSTCSVMLLPRSQIKLSTEISRYNSRFLKLHCEFIWFLEITLRNPSTHVEYYVHLVKSHERAIYLEIKDFSLISFIRIPSTDITCGAENAVLSPLKFHEKPNIGNMRKAWESLHLNLHKCQIRSEHPFGFTPLSLYFQDGESVPCSSYPPGPRLFLPEECVLVMVSVKHNFSIDLGSLSHKPEIH